MKSSDAQKQNFSNHRQWREFVATIQCSVPYPKFVNALRAGKALFDSNFDRASDSAPVWLTPARP